MAVIETKRMKIFVWNKLMKIQEGIKQEKTQKSSFSEIFIL